MSSWFEVGLRVTQGYPMTLGADRFGGEISCGKRYYHSEQHIYMHINSDNSCDLEDRVLFLLGSCLGFFLTHLDFGLKLHTQVSLHHKLKI